MFSLQNESESEAGISHVLCNYKKWKNDWHHGYQRRECSVFTFPIWAHPNDRATTKTLARHSCSRKKHPVPTAPNNTCQSSVTVLEPEPLIRWLLPKWIFSADKEQLLILPSPCNSTLFCYQYPENRGRGLRLAGEAGGSWVWIDVGKSMALF